VHQQIVNIYIDSKFHAGGHAGIPPRRGSFFSFDGWEKKRREKLLQALFYSSVNR
jgi:hypothetical protein